MSNWIKLIVRKLLFSIRLLPYFLLKLIPRRKKLWLITSRFGHSYSGNPRAIFQFLLEQNDHNIRFYFITKNRELYNNLSRQYPGHVVYFHSAWGKFLAMRAGVYIYNHTITSISFRLSGGVMSVNTWHGLALKKIKYDNKFNSPENSSVPFAKRYILDHSNTYICATSEFTKGEFARAFRKNRDQVLVTGYPRNDMLNTKHKAENKTKFFSRHSLPPSFNSILFYLPTHSNTESKVFKEFNINNINTLCCELNVLLLYKRHPSSTLKIDNKDYSNILLLDQSEEIYSILSFTDVLITDYSSIFFDYLLLNLPIIFFAPDLKEYIERSRELYFTYEDFVPGPIAQTHSELVHILKELLIYDKDNYTQERLDVRTRFFDYPDFNSSKRFVDTLNQTMNA